MILSNIIIFWLCLLRQGKEKEKNKHMEVQQTKNSIHSKGNHQQNKKTT